ncbi:MAG: MATE family efflux transporter [Lachnospiraceae bacterium]|nr:MATE family efflux transporter [Lachnospiraceae bacterium]
MIQQNKKDKRIFILSEEKPAKAVFKLGIPLVAGMFIMVLYNLVDTYFIGLTKDDYQLAAVNLAYPIMMIAIAVANMVGTGAASLIARSLGAGQTEKANHTVTVGVLLTVINSVLMTVVGLYFLQEIVSGLGAKANTVAFTEQYAEVILWGSIFTMGSFTLGQLLRSEGSVKISIMGMVIGTIANMILDPVFIFGLGLQIRGAAIATILGNALSTGISLWFYISGKTLLKMRWRYLRPTKEILKEIFWVGVPATLETLLSSVAYIVNNNLAVGYGELTVAAMGIAQKIMTLGNYIYQGMASGTQPLMGYNYGAKNYARMLQVLKAGLLVVSSMEGVVMLVFGVFAPQLIGIFTENPEVIDIGSCVLRAVMCILPFVGAVSMSRTSFQAMGKPQYAFGITLMRQLILYVPLLLALNCFIGFYGMIWAQPITEVIMMMVSVGILYRIIKKLQNGGDGNVSTDET